MTEDEVKKILNVGVLLSSERSINKLLEKILISVMEISHCDAGTLYLLEEEELHFVIMRNSSRGVCLFLRPAADQYQDRAGGDHVTLLVFQHRFLPRQVVAVDGQAAGVKGHVPGKAFGQVW